MRPEIVDKMERRANLSILDSFASSNIYSGTIASAKSINVVRFIDQSKSNDSFRDGNVFCNQSDVFKSTIQNGLRSICECLKINPDAHNSEQEVMCVIISGIKALQLKYSLELKTNAQLKNDNETLIITVNNQKADAERVVNENKEIKRQNHDIYKTVTMLDRELGSHEIESAAKTKELQSRILALNQEVFQVKEGEEKQKLENLKLLQNIAELQKLEIKVGELTTENKSLETKNTTLKKLTKEKENKIDKLSSQLTSSRSKYASKLKSLELETGKTIDSLLVELKLVKDINEKLLAKDASTMETLKGVLTTTYDS